MMATESPDLSAMSHLRVAAGTTLCATLDREGRAAALPSRRRGAGIRQASGRIRDLVGDAPVMGFGFGGSRPLKGPDRQLHGADGDDVAVANRSRSFEALIPDKRPILASQVFDRRAGGRDLDLCVAPGYPRGVQVDFHARVASDHMHTFVERHPPACPRDPERYLAATLQTGFGMLHRFAKRVPKSGHRPDESSARRNRRRSRRESRSRDWRGFSPPRTWLATIAPEALASRSPSVCSPPGD